MLQAEIDAFHASIKARALLIMIEWAGSARQLGMMIGLGRYAGHTWLKRGFIPPLAAIALEKLPGAPLKASEMHPGVTLDAYRAQIRCPHCHVTINPPSDKTGCSPLLKDVRKRYRKYLAAGHKTRRPNGQAKPKSL